MKKLGSQKWAIILCEFAGTTDGPAVNLDFCERFFLTAGQSGLYDYWKDLSGGRLDFNGSVIFGPFELSYTLAEGEASASSQSTATKLHPRVFHIQDIIDDLGDRVDYKGIQALIILVNKVFDAGAAGGNIPHRGRTRSVPAAIFDPASFYQEMLGHLFEHETAHMLGLGHSARLWAREEWAGRGATDADWAYTDGWCITGGKRDDGPLIQHDGTRSIRHCRFYINNNKLNNALSGPALKARAVKDLGWLPSDRVYTYRSFSQCGRRMAALYREEVTGDRMIQTTRTYSNSARYSVELRWKEGWDRGIPRHAFLVHRLEDDGTTLLVPKSPTQHDWVAEDRFESIADGIGIDFESIDEASRSGYVRLSRVVGQSADELVAGGWGMIALQRGKGTPYRYLGRPGKWHRVGQPAAQFAISGNALYGLSGNRQKTLKYTGRDDQWVQVGESADAIIAGGWGLIALQRGTGVPFLYLGRPGRWRRVGAPAAQFAITGNSLFGLAGDRQKIWRYTGQGQSWEQVGQSADALVAGGFGMLALQKGTGIPFLYLGRPGHWRKIGAPAAQFCFSTDALYALSNDRRAIWRYTGKDELWTRVGGAAHSIATGGKTLFSLSPARSSITQY